MILRFDYAQTRWPHSTKWRKIMSPERTGTWKETWKKTWKETSKGRRNVGKRVIAAKGRSVAKRVGFSFY